MKKIVLIVGSLIIDNKQESITNFLAKYPSICTLKYSQPSWIKPLESLSITPNFRSDPSFEKYQNIKNFLLTTSTRPIVADFSDEYIKYAEYFLQDYENTYLLCIKGDKNEQIKRFARKLITQLVMSGLVENNQELKNFCTTINPDLAPVLDEIKSQSSTINVEHDHYDLTSIKHLIETKTPEEILEILSINYDKIYQTCEALQKIYPTKVKIIYLENGSLNDANSILEFINP